jgi:hypothetical protein
LKKAVLQSVTGGFKRVILQSADALKICLPLPSVYVHLVLIKHSLKKKDSGTVNYLLCAPAYLMIKSPIWNNFQILDICVFRGRET